MCGADIFQLKNIALENFLPHISGSQEACSPIQKDKLLMFFYGL